MNGICRVGQKVCENMVTPSFTAVLQKGQGCDGEDSAFPAQFVVPRVQQTLPERHKHHLGNNTQVQVSICASSLLKLGLSILELDKVEQVDMGGSRDRVDIPTTGLEDLAHLIGQSVHHVSFFLVLVKRPRVQSHGRIQVQYGFTVAVVPRASFDARGPGLFELSQNVHGNVHVIRSAFDKPGPVFVTPLSEIKRVFSEFVLVSSKDGTHNVVRVRGGSKVFHKLGKFGKHALVDISVHAEFGFGVRAQLCDRSKVDITGIDIVEIRQGFCLTRNGKFTFRNKATTVVGFVETSDKATDILIVHDFHLPVTNHVIVHDGTRDFFSRDACTRYYGSLVQKEIQASLG
mmetsp:Transcript_12262/g.24831  ORF Transcript_12262/g.24831 Transcript_12262/m.24831 type:complete len:346 (-) Transcript_12262:453-1490(-)